MPWFLTPLCFGALATIFYLSSDAQDAANKTGSVQVVGSETMRAAVTTCAADFMSRNPQADIVVKGGGSGHGVAALLHGIVDIGMTSRDLSRRERDYAASKNIEIAVAELARDGIAIVVNRANAITALDIRQLHDIYSGKTRNWRDLEGGDADIVAYARAEGSGTASLFGERVMGEDPYVASVLAMPTNEAIVAEVAMRPGAIGYTSLGAVKGAGDRIKVIALRPDVNSAPVAPTVETVRSGQYPLTRTLYLGTVGKPLGPVQTFIDFCSGAGGQALLERAGYVTIARVAR